ncbi:acyl-CoA/acyl-ACP dehydrogenase [Rhodococcus triatomae]|uniref:Acyl-CoA dehydrogenase n=1 Tax=Rhodococcus triatomae TaxID=300028 RepID=A0A1G8QIK4_9NOCA|nr:acyl-CoA dehydrogenase family protein [Rhodococcus triatomae]QNG20660.1 acyl-CoA/acyl-ACP dehydrogenase [Rhodococcus triatomae]QNG23422.1 acyl-CoA/acyl-ACP dehydrogenase [Rhodococcus triatomae]SDJ04547.1 acyl-CoA dehydrogenase [Rhodococcus triatomae]
MINKSVLDYDFPTYLKVIADFTENELIPAENEMVDAGEVPARIVDRMAELGLFAITIPREYGGLGWTMEQQVQLTFEFTRASCVYRSRFSTVIGLCSQAILDHGTEEQRRQMLPAMAAGELVTAFALTEEFAGSDAASLRTTARRKGGVYVIDGSKRYITNAGWADAFIVFARTDETEPGAAGVSAFVVDAKAPGVRTALPTIMNGHAEGPVGEIYFDSVEVPAANLLGGREGEGKGLVMALRGINHARTHVAATCVGQATRMLEETTAHVIGRRQFGSPLSELGAVQAELGASFAEMEAGRALVIESARAFDSGVVPRHRIAAAKLYGSEMASRVADRCVQLLGGEGIVGPHPVPRMWRDVRALRIYEGSSPIHERNLAKAMIKQVGADGTLPDSYRA